MKYIKLFENFEEHWEEEDQDVTENLFDINKVEKFEKSIIAIIDEMEELFDDGYGDQLEEPDNENVLEQMDELVYDLKMTKDDIKEVINRNKEKKNHINDWIHLLESYIEEDRAYDAANVHDEKEDSYREIEIGRNPFGIPNGVVDQWYKE